MSTLQRGQENLYFSTMVLKIFGSKNVHRLTVDKILRNKILCIKNLEKNIFLEVKSKIFARLFLYNFENPPKMWQKLQNFWISC